MSEYRTEHDMPGKDRRKYDRTIKDMSGEDI